MIYFFQRMVLDMNLTKKQTKINDSFTSAQNLYIGIKNKRWKKVLPSNISNHFTFIIIQCDFGCLLLAI